MGEVCAVIRWEAAGGGGKGRAHTGETSAALLAVALVARQMRP